MNELGIPFIKQILRPLKIDKDDITKGKRHFHTLRVCKECRADWMNSIKVWFENKPVIEESCGSGIFIRENGALKEITEEEWYKRNPDCEPVKVKKDEQ